MLSGLVLSCANAWPIDAVASKATVNNNCLDITASPEIQRADLHAFMSVLYGIQGVGATVCGPDPSARWRPWTTTDISQTSPLTSWPALVAPALPKRSHC